jgi:hypothetical protein
MAFKMLVHNIKYLPPILFTTHLEEYVKYIIRDDNSSTASLEVGVYLYR